MPPPPSQQKISYSATDDQSNTWGPHKQFSITSKHQP